MKKIILNIFFHALAALLCLSSCALEEPIDTPQNSDGYIEFVARPMGFLNQTADTKATATAFEKTIHNCFFLLFDNSTGALVGEPVNLTSSISNNSFPTQQVRLEKVNSNAVTACFIANVPKSNIDKIIGLTRPAEVENTYENNQRYLYNATLDITYAADGIIGTPSLDLNGDNHKIECIPMIGIHTISLPADNVLIQVPVKRLFAKVCFNINLNLTESGESGSAEPYFHVSNCIVNNLPTKVAFKEGKYLGADNSIKYIESAWVDNSDAFTSEYQYEYDVDIENDNIDDNGLTFEFYVPEYILLPDPTKLSEINKITDDATRERMKPTLRKDGTCPLYVSIKGIYGSVFGEEIEMTYDLYPGANQYDDFNLLRNVQYNNNVTIRGTSYVDNRVEMKYAGFHVGFPHSVQMDSHFNVRPLRLKFSDDFRVGLEQGIYADGEIKIEILNTNGQSSWIALERPIASNIPEGNTVYSKGVKGAIYPTKRRYFTTNLISNLNSQTVDGKDDSSAGQSVTFRTDDANALTGDVITWVYVDEYTTQSTSNSREATIAVTFTMDGSSEGVTKQYLVRQSAIYPIETEYAIDNVINKRSYGLELFEEYTMNYDSEPYYDSDDNIGFHSNVNGIKWGLKGIDLSRNKPALNEPDDIHVTVGSDTDASLKSYLTTGISLAGTNYNLITTTIEPSIQSGMKSQLKDLDCYYDFYTTDEQDSDFMSSLFGTDGTRDYEGFEMNVEIIHTLLTAYGSEAPAKLNQMILDETPLSVIAYCYNKNKRNDNGEVISVKSDGSLDISNYHWYAPSIKELEEIMVQAYNSGEWVHDEFKTFSNNMYWTCQPAYHKNRYDVDYSAKSQWVLDYLYNSKDDRTVKASYSADAVGYFLQDDSDRARATKYVASEETIISSSSLHISNEMKITGSFKKDHSETYYAKVFKPSTLLNNLLAYPTVTADYFLSFMDYLGDVTWTRGEISPISGVTIDIGDGNNERTTVNRVRCVYEDHNYNTATRREYSAIQSVFGNKGYNMTYSR